MMPGIGKVVASLATVGSIGGVGTVTYFALSNTENIGGRLKTEGFKVLDPTTTKGDWTPVLTTYQKAQNNTFAGALAKDATEDYLKNKCRESLNSKVDDTKNYQLAKQWCVKEETINSFLSRNNYTVLSVATENQNETKFWKQKIEELLKDVNKFVATTLDKSKRVETADIAAIKKGCETLKTSSTKTTSNDFEKNIKLTIEWCSVKNKDK